MVIRYHSRSGIEINVLFLSDKFKDLLKFTESTVAVIMESLVFHRRNTQLNAVGLMAIENILRSGKYYLPQLFSECLFCLSILYI